MKIGVVLSNAASDLGGGYTIERDLYQALLKCAPESKHQITVFSWDEKTDNAALKAAGIEHFSFKAPDLVTLLARKISSAKYKFETITRLALTQKSKRWIENIIELSEVDLLWYLTPDVITMEKPFITIVWDLQHRLQPYFPEVSSEGEWSARDKHYRTVLPRATIVLTGTEAGKKEIENFYQIPSERIKLVRHPTPAFVLGPEKSNTHHVRPKYDIVGDYVFYPAQFWPHKNHVSILMALKNLKENGLKISAVFSGSDKGNLSYVKEKVQELRLSDQIHFLGFVPQDELVELYQNALALTYVSFCGPENLPPLEAFATGCPVIAARVAGAEEQLGDAAVLINPKSEIEIADAIRALHSDSALRKRLVDKGLKRATQFTGVDFVQSVFKACDELEPILRAWK